MYEWISANWIWLLFGIGLAWFLFGRAGMSGGMGCGMGGHSHESEPSHGEQFDPHAGHTSGSGAMHEHDVPASAPPRRRHGCC